MRRLYRLTPACLGLALIIGLSALLTGCASTQGERQNVNLYLPHVEYAD